MSTTIIRGPEAGPQRSWRHWLTGKPLATAEAPHQTLSKKVGLAVFASDALSSTAYATDEILLVLAAAGTAAFALSLPIAISIIILLLIITVSYEQTIHAYPNGGGAYLVARDNLGPYPAQIAGAALLTDYILTVAVSISSGVAQVTSAFPSLLPFKVELALGFIALMTLINLRGVKESGVAFAVPTYLFLGMTAITIIYGYFQYFTGTLGVVTGVEPMHEALEGLTAFLILRAFSSGCTALTGIEAISDGITAFKEPRSRNAGTTLIWMTAILSTMFFSITFLAQQTSAVPSHIQTVFSQIGSVIYGAGSAPYLALLGTTTLILVMAANTAYADFPRLAAWVAGDGFLPKQLTYRGSRLAFSYGIIVLAIVASILVIVFQAQTSSLIPLYAIGVFLSFTISQTGMAMRWWRSSKLKPGEEIQQKGSSVHYEPNWKLKMAINGFGAAISFIVMIIFAVTKFLLGAWIIVIVIPVLVFLFLQIHSHYKSLAKQLSLDTFGAPTRVRRNRVILPIGGVHRGTVHALNFARSLSDDVTAVHVAMDQIEEDKVRSRWEKWGDGVRLVLIPSPYRALLEPMIQYIREVASQRQPGDMLTVVVPEFLPQKPWQNILHMQTAFFLRMGLLGLRNIVIMEVPYHGDAA